MNFHMCQVADRSLPSTLNTAVKIDPRKLRGYLFYRLALQDRVPSPDCGATLYQDGTCSDVAAVWWCCYPGYINEIDD